MSLIGSKSSITIQSIPSCPSAFLHRQDGNVREICIHIHTWHSNNKRQGVIQRTTAREETHKISTCPCCTLRSLRPSTSRNLRLVRHGRKDIKTQSVRTMMMTVHKFCSYKFLRGQRTFFSDFLAPRDANTIEKKTYAGRKVKVILLGFFPTALEICGLYMVPLGQNCFGDIPCCNSQFPVTE